MTDHASLAADRAQPAEHEIGPDGVFYVRLHAGELIVEGTDGTTIRVRDLDGRDLAERFELRPEAASFTLRPLAQLGELGLLLGGRRSSRVEAQVPRTATIVVNTVSGDVTTRGLVGHQRLATTSGTVRILDADGDVQAQTVSGSLVIRSAGELDLSARTVSGSADMSAARIRRLSLATTSGHLRLAGSLTGDGPFAMRTVSGDVEARLTGDVRVEARTLTGRIHSETQPESQPAARSGRRPVTIGNSGPVLSFESVSGGLWLAGPRPAPPMPPAAPSPPAPPTPPAHLAEEPGGQIPAAITREPGEDAAEGLDILRSLERGEIDVATALQRLEQLEREPETGNEPSESSFGGRT